MLLENKVVLITGASRGIGRATAIEAARQGADVALNTFRDEAAAAQVVAEIEALGRRAIAVDGDVAQPESAAAFIAAAVQALGRVDVFVSNAGICPFHAFLDMPVETLRRTMEVNLHGAYFMTHKKGQALNKHLVLQDAAAFSNVGDCAFDNDGHHGTPNQRLRAAQWAGDLALASKPASSILPAMSFDALFEAKLPQLVAPDAK